MSKWSVAPAISLQSEFRSGNFPRNENVSSIEFIEADSASIPLGPFEYLLVSVEEWERYWQEQDDYIPDDLTRLPEYRSKCAEKYKIRVPPIKEGLSQHGKLNALVFCDWYPGMLVRLSDGRHRFSILRQLKVPVFLAAAPPGAARELKRLCFLNS